MYLIEEYYEDQFISLKSMKKKFRRKYKIYRESFLLKNFCKYFLSPNVLYKGKFLLQHFNAIEACCEP